VNQEKLGNWGEKRAAENLVERGYLILAANYRTKLGEIDLMAWDGRELIAVEVKTRSGDGYGTPAEAVTQTKLATIKMVVLQFMAQHSLDCGVRVEVLEVEKSGAVRVIEGIDFE
jgi:putative endonuclease